MGVLSHEAKFKQDVTTRSKHSGEDVICCMGGVIRTHYVCTYVYTYIHTNTYIFTHIRKHTYIPKTTQSARLKGAPAESAGEDNAI